MAKYAKQSSTGAARRTRTSWLTGFFSSGGFSMMMRKRNDWKNNKRKTAKPTPAAAEHAARADAVDHEPRHRLEQRREQIEERRGEAQGGVRHAQVRLDERKERRHDDLEEMARAVRQSYQGDNDVIALVFHETIL